MNRRNPGDPLLKTSKQLVDDANAQVVTIPVADAVDLLGDPRVLFVDIRDPRELERDGQIPGAYRAPRGMLEFWIDPDSPYHKPVFAEDKKFVFFCAGAMRSALAAQTAQRMGLKPVAHIEGGFSKWKKEGGPFEMDEREVKK